MVTKDNSSNGLQKNPTDQKLVEKLEEEIEANLQNEQFNVEELAGLMNMSRSHLHRKLKKATGQSANQFIREYRLQKGMELLKLEDMTVSEVAFKVGFGSHSYFSTCFTEHYGYPPGEAKFRATETDAMPNPQTKGNSHRFKLPTKLLALVGLVALGLLIVFSLVKWQSADPESEGVPKANDQSVAVLPLKNLNVDQEYEYFSEGVVQAINRHLSQLGNLKVISLTSTDRYRETDLSAQQIGEELKVANLLEGSIQRQENTIRIEVRLIETSSGRQIWAEKYDREWEKILKTQTEIAKNVTLALKSTLSSEEKAVLGQKMTDNVEAYDLYLKGGYESKTFTRIGIQRGMEYYEQAITLDTGFALAYTGLAANYMLKASIFGAELSALDGMALAKPLLNKALALDPDLTEAHYWMGYYLLFNHWDFEGAEQEYKKAIVNNNPDALFLYADLLQFSARHEEALTIAQRLNETNPFYPNSKMAVSLYYLEQYDEAEDIAQSRMRLFNDYLTIDNYGFLMLNTGNYQKAISLFQKAVALEGVRYPRMLGWMGATYAHSGERKKALELIEELKAKISVNDAGSIRFFIAVVYAALGEKPAALQWLQAAYAEHEMEMPWLISEPQFYNLHAEPEFQQLAKAIGFPAYSLQ
ncbi:MAG: helix-turn-helix domain-containing protein [Tunicatimonas sp.]|uniref:helix-turn-helix domain-containing protein n=1 Tax=Tunicatimonas sp. TaxID=1940096 RepID=UPI003C791BB7